MTTLTYALAALAVVVLIWISITIYNWGYNDGYNDGYDNATLASAAKEP